ncbi:diacylglycerol/lipid kinase family protein [Candidatus Mycosynbacter amalyticus]|nr:diacylglycerol kinase family protein [Candidatus Mycosynbacter amalyticus]
MNIVLVYNPRSGTALPLEALREKCSAHDITIEHAVDITDGFPANLTPHIAPGAHIAAIGGDGTLSSVAQQLHDTEVIFVPLPGGTLNHFTKDAGISQDLDEALATLAHATPRHVDVGSANGRIFLNNSSLGIYPTSLRTREVLQGRLGKWPSAVLAVLQALIKFKLYTVTMEGETFRTPFIFIGNNDYHIGNGGQRTSLTSGKLCAYAIRSPRRSTLVTLFFYALFRRLRDADEFIVHSDSSLTIATKRSRISVSADGEVLRLDAPLEYKCLAGKLTILG